MSEIRDTVERTYDQNGMIYETLASVADSVTVERTCDQIWNDLRDSASIRNP